MSNYPQKLEHDFGVIGLCFVCVIVNNTNKHTFFIYLFKINILILSVFQDSTDR